MHDDGIPNNTTFEEGDWDRDGDFDVMDIIFALQFGVYTSDDRHSTIAQRFLFGTPVPDKTGSVERATKRLSRSA